MANGSFVNGYISNAGDAMTGDKYTSSLMSNGEGDNDFMVVVTFKSAFSATNVPIGLASPNGNSNGQTCSVQVSNTSLVFQSANPTPFSFLVTDKGLGYY